MERIVGQVEIVRQTTRRPGWLAAGLASLVVLLPANVATAHTPHDDIFDVQLSPDFNEDGVALTISRGILLKSVDYGRSWTRRVNGLDNRHDLISLHLSQSDPNVAFVSSGGDGVYRTTDQGESWHLVSTGLGTLDIALLAGSPQSPDVLYAAGAETGVFRTADGGESWDAVGDPDLHVTSVGFLPDPPYCAVIGDDRGVIHMCGEGGATTRSTRIPGAGAIRSIAMSQDDRTFFVGTDDGGIFKTTDGGSSFIAASDGISDPSISSVVVSERFESDPMVWASTRNDGVFSSVDGGASWTHTSQGLVTVGQAGSRGYEDRPDFGVLRVSVEPADGRRTMLLAGFAGVFRSTDGGRSWHEVETLSSRILVGLAVSPDYASDATMAIATYVDGALLSADRGETWQAMNDGLANPSPGGATRLARLYGVAFSPSFRSDRTLFSATGSTFLRSTDGGHSWRSIEVQAENGNERPYQFIIAVSPDYARDETVLLADGTSGDVFASTDGGVTFSRQGGVGRIRSAVISPDFAADGTLVVGTGHGVYRSVDRGVTWSPIGLESLNVAKLAISPDFGDDATIFAGTLDGLFVTRDAGATWGRPSSPAIGAGAAIEAVAISPGFPDDGTVLVSARGRGLHKSTDGGTTYAPVATQLLEGNLQLDNYSKATTSSIVFSPDYTHDQTVFGFSGTTLLKSTDGGASWHSIDYPASESTGSTKSFSSTAGDVLIVVSAAAGLGLLALGALRLQRARRKSR